MSDLLPQNEEEEEDWVSPEDGEETSLIKQQLAQAHPDVDQKTSYPKAVFFIIGNEFCERFSFYGMRTILTIFLSSMLAFSGDDSTMIFHVFVMACYFTPILGAIIADSWLGKFKTILYISIVYAIGNIVISVGAIPNDLDTMKILSLVGLGLIALGTGGIKPCVAAFGGDQFEPGQERYLQQFFSFFYLSINLGSTISTFLTPVLRDDVRCFGTRCWPLAFGVPAILMILSLVLFLLGKSLYKILPPKGNIVVTVSKCIGHAVTQRCKSKGRKRDHWLDYAEDSYDRKFIQDIKTMLHVLMLYIPLPVFWALFDQQGSRWTLQATQMDGRFFGYIIKPDQMQFVNPLFVIILIPLFEYAIYPALRKCHLLVRPLQRITVGGILAAGAFVIAGFLQLAIEKTYPVYPEPNMSETRIINNSPCNLTLNGTRLEPFSDVLWEQMPLGDERRLFIEGACGQLKESVDYRLVFQYPIQSLTVTRAEGSMKFVQVEDAKHKDKLGYAEFRIFFNTKEEQMRNQTGGFELRGKKENFHLYSSSNESSGVGVTDYVKVLPGEYKLFLIGEVNTEGRLVGEAEFKPGGRYIGTVYQDPDNETAIHMTVITAVMPNSVHILFQVPQYIIITVGEIMFSVTGLEFSYSQAPSSMKSVLQAAWLLTVAFGNLIVVIVAEAKLFEQQSIEFFMFATLMGVDMLLFAVMAVFYKYVNSTDNGEEKPEPAHEEKSEPKMNSGKTNPGFEEDTHF